MENIKKVEKYEKLLYSIGDVLFYCGGYHKCIIKKCMNETDDRKPSYRIKFLNDSYKRTHLALQSELYKTQILF